MAFIYVRLVACIGKFLIWLTILVIGVGGIMLSVLLIQRGIKDSKDAESEDIAKIEIALGIILMIFLILIWLSLWFIRRRIGTAIEMLDEASHAIRDMKTTLIFPCIYSFVGLIYLLFWCFVLMYIYSVQNKQEGKLVYICLVILSYLHRFFNFFCFLCCDVGSTRSCTKFIGN